MTPFRRLATGIVAMAAVTAVSACGDSDSGSQASSTSGGGGTDKINLAILDSNVTSSTLVLADKNGFFEDNGLDVTLQPVQAPALVPSVMGGTSQFAFLNAPATLVARGNNVPIVAVSAVSSMPEDATGSPLAVVAPAGSGITSPRDLEGKTVAVDTLYQVPHLGTLNALESEGVDTSKVKFTEVAFPQMLDALAKGRVDAATVIEPFLSQALAAGNESVVSVASGGEGWPVGVVIASEQYAGQNAKIVDKLKRAIAEASDYANENPGELRALIPTFTQVPAEAAAKIRLYDWTSDYNDDGWNGWARLLEKQGVVKGDLDADAAHR